MRPPAQLGEATVGRNDACPCGSGRKFKQCCGSANPAQADLAALTLAGGVFDRAEDLLRPRVVEPSGVPRAAAKDRRPVAVDRYATAGMRALAKGHTQDAVSALREAVRLDPDDAGLQHRFGLALAAAQDLDAAAEASARALALRPGFAEAQYQLALVLDQQGRDAEAIAAYQRAVELAPRLAAALIRLGDLLERNAQPDRAIECFRRAVAAQPGGTDGRLYRVRLLMAEGRMNEAEPLLRQVLALEPGSWAARKILADLLTAQGQFEQAVQSFDAAIAANPRQSLAHYGLAMARKLTDADRWRIDRMIALLHDPALLQGDRMTLHFAAGKGLADVGDYQAAMRHFDDANHIRAQTARFDQAAFAARIDQLIAAITAALLAERPDYATNDETPLLIIGMPRSGTTLVEQIVSSHSQIVAGGEIPFWVTRDPDLELRDRTGFQPDAARGMAAEYLSRLRRLGPQAQRVTDKLPFNFLRLGLIHMLLPRARIIHCRRNPIDTCLSIYSLQFRARMDFAARKSDLAFVYRQYERLMHHWRAVLPPDRFLDIDYETLVDDPPTQSRRLIEFTGLEWEAACLRPEQNRRTVDTASMWQARQPVYRDSVERWRRYEPWLGELRDLLPAG
ncbi:MAG TPA: sulfotransferase [Acetobacteraceae bacterium]